MIYQLINKPWEAVPVLLRARRIIRHRNRIEERELVEFWAAMVSR